MQKISKIKIGKSITAVLLCVVLLVTSIPMVLAAGEGEYDPIPTFTESDKREAAATLNDDGGITVSFPAAKVSERKTGTKTIDGYMLELVDLGTYTEVHTSTVLLRKMVSPTGTAPYTAEITADEIKTKVPAGLSDDHRYNITITAYDSDGWFSEAVNAYVSDVPTYVYDADAYAPVTNNVLAVREVLTFDKKGKADDHGSYSDTGINERTAEVNNVRSTSGSLDYMQEGNHLSFEGRTDGVGVKDTGNSYGYAMRIESAATTDSPQSFDTSWSRQTWDPTGASEIWYYLDFSEVSVTGLSFRLRANEKYFAQDFDNSYSESSNAFNRYGDIIYSTVGTTKAGYMGEAPYLFLQQTDGSWKKVMLNDGTVDLDHFKGYVRIPLQFMCSETDSVVTESNEDFGVNKPMPDMYVWNSSDKTKANANKYYNEKIKLSQPVVVDPAGTSISDALLIRRYSFRINKTSWTSGEYYIDGGTMLAPCMATEDGGKTTANSPKRAYIDKTKIGTGEDPVVNRTNAFKAIEDIMSAGFKFTGCTYDPASTSLETNNGSVGKKIFLDNVLFYRTDGQKYSENTLNGAANTGTPVKTYYDQETEIPRAIFNACQKYIEDPNSYDYRAVKYIEDLIAGYKKSIEEYNKSEEAGKSGIIDASFLEESALDTKAAALGMTEAWEKYKTAKQACIDGKTYGSANSGAEDFIPMISTKLEQLPDFDENTLAVSDEDKAVVKSLYEVYIRLNLSQLAMLGRAEEEKLLKYFSFIEEELADNSVVIGQALTNNKVIPFGDFDSLKKGTRSWQFENSKYAGKVGQDYYYSKGYLTYQVPFASLSAHREDTATPTLIPTGALGNDPQRNGITDYRQNGTSAYGADVQNRTGDVSFDDYAQVKSLTSMQFENAVADVDIYKANTRTEKINTALALYAQLSDYQKSIPSVARAYSVLQKYKSIDDGITLLDQPQLAVADLKPLIEAMPAAATGGSVTGSNALPYPGFVIGTDASGTEKPLINYGAYSLTAADVQNIINWYEQSYERYTDEAIAALGAENVTKMENLYKVAKRLRLLEAYRDGYTSDSGTAITGIKDLNALVASMYGETGKATDLTTDCRLMPTGQTAALENYLEKYNDLDYYAKYILTDKADKFASAPQYKNYAKVAEAVNKVLANIKTYTDDITGKTVKGGVVRLEEKYTALYNTVKGQMDNSGIQDLTAITEAVEEYNSFKGYIRQVQEVNDGNTVNSSDGEALHGIIDTLRIFPNFASEVDKDSVALNKDATTGTAVFTLSNAVNYPDGSYTLRVTSKNGGLKDTTGITHDYNVAMTGAIEKTVTAKALNTSPETADVANNTASAAAPKAINFTFTVTGVTVTSEDVITIELIDNATGEVAVDKTTNEPVRKTINIHFAADDFFEVTIPAEIDVPWGETEAVDVSYKVTSSLDTGSKIGVSVARSASVANDTLTNAATSTYALPYTSQNFTSTEFTGTNEGALPAQKPSLTISGWTDAPIAEYSTTLTYTVDYTKG